MQAYRIEVEHDSADRPMIDEVAWAIARQLTRGVAAVTVKLIKWELEAEARQQRITWSHDRAPQWIPEVLRGQPISSWTDEQVIRVAVGNAAIRTRGSLAGIFDDRPQALTIGPDPDSTYVRIRLETPAEEVPRRPLVMRSG